MDELHCRNVSSTLLLDVQVENRIWTFSVVFWILCMNVHHHERQLRQLVDATSQHRCCPEPTPHYLHKSAHLRSSRTDLLCLPPNAQRMLWRLRQAGKLHFCCRELSNDGTQQRLHHWIIWKGWWAAPLFRDLESARASRQWMTYGGAVDLQRLLRREMQFEASRARRQVSWDSAEAEQAMISPGPTSHQTNLTSQACGMVSLSSWWSPTPRKFPPSGRPADDCILRALYLTTFDGNQSRGWCKELSA